MRQFVSILTFSIMAVVFLATASFKKPLKNVPTLTKQEVTEAASFLHQCSYFEENWEFSHDLMTGEDFNIVVVPYDEPGVCGRFVPSGGSDYIFLYPQAFDSEGCYGGNAMLVLAHEMLHQLGMPPHYIPQSNWEEYVLYDPIEVTMRKCILEAIREERPIEWSRDKGKVNVGQSAKAR